MKFHRVAIAALFAAFFVLLSPPTFAQSPAPAGSPVAAAADSVPATNPLAPVAPDASPTPPAAPAPKKAKQVKARVLVDCRHGKCNDVVEIDEALAKAGEAAGELDTSKAAVAYAESLIG